MKTMYQYLIDVKKKLNIPSDNKLAQLLDLNRATIAMVKAGGSVSDATALKIAEALEIEYEEVLLAATAQRSNNPVIRKAWENISKRSGIAANVFINVSLGAQGLEALLWIAEKAGNKGILYIMLNSIVIIIHTVKNARTRNLPGNIFNGNYKSEKIHCY